MQSSAGDSSKKQKIVAAIQQSNAQMLAQLLQGFDLETPLTMSGSTTLMVCCAETTNKDVLRAILKSRPNLLAQDTFGRTALHYACKNGSVDFISELCQADQIKNGGMNAQTHGGDTPLMYACQSGSLYAVAECLNQNFNPFFENALRMTARDYAAQFPSNYAASI